MLLGVVLMLAWSRGNPAFFRQRPGVFGAAE
jgi:hypothetical protein